jgi:hypothetical protein
MEEDAEEEEEDNAGEDKEEDAEEEEKKKEEKGPRTFLNFFKFFKINSLKKQYRFSFIFPC